MSDSNIDSWWKEYTDGEVESVTGDTVEVGDVYLRKDDFIVRVTKVTDNKVNYEYLYYLRSNEWYYTDDPITSFINNWGFFYDLKVKLVSRYKIVLDDSLFEVD